MLFVLLAASAFAASVGGDAPIPVKHPDALAKLNPKQPADLAQMLDRFGSALVGKPYELGPLGEGAGSRHPKPLYRLDAFDCTTFVETVMANAYCAKAGAQAPVCLASRIKSIRYRGSKISFAERNHIPEVDWLPANERRGYLENLAGKIFPGEWKEAKITVDRKAWLAQQGEAGSGPKPGGTLSYLPVGTFFQKAELKPVEEKAAEEQLAKAAAEAKDQPEEEKAKAKFRAEMEFLKAAFTPLNEKLAQIPSGTVLNLIRRPAKTAAEGRLQTLVAHQGLVVQRADGAHILQAVPSGHVRDQLLGDYLRRYVRSAHFQGVSLYRILPVK